MNSQKMDTQTCRLLLIENKADLDVDYVSIGNANRARTITPSTVAVFLQINLWIVQAKSDGSEKPPLKISVSNCLLYDGFFLLPSCGRLNYI